MMKAENIMTRQDAQRYVEGVINDFELGISTKGETLGYLGEYTGRLMQLFGDNMIEIMRKEPDTKKSTEK